MNLNVYSEIGQLKKVLLHRPSHEIENLIPEFLDEMLFDDIPYLEVAQQEHDFFANELKNSDVEVLYLEKLAEETIAQDINIKSNFISEFLDEAHISDNCVKDVVSNYLLSFDNKTIIGKLISGIRKNEIPYNVPRNLTEYVNEDYPFITDPLPNLYFTRDPFVTIGSGICLSHMSTDIRQRETLFSKYIFNYHPNFKDQQIPFWYHRDDDTCIEGGDILTLGQGILAIGISQRTEPDSIEKLSRRLFSSKFKPENPIKTVLALQIPSTRAFMHLDTVFTQVDYDKFTLHGEIEGPLRIYAISPSVNGDSISINEEFDNLENILSKYLDRKITLIKCGGGDKIVSGREQWNEGFNSLNISPGEVVVYQRNYVTNQILQDNGIKLHVIPSSELSRGRGGPRCMSMPLDREDIY
ncbi:MAG TPA: arginine deiminase [Victivallales bacterium]|nr:arginine deiminase [Victivallales bacterium]